MPLAPASRRLGNPEAHIQPRAARIARRRAATESSESEPPSDDPIEPRSLATELRVEEDPLRSRPCCARGKVCSQACWMRWLRLIFFNSLPAYLKHDQAKSCGVF